MKKLKNKLVKPIAALLLLLSLVSCKDENITPSIEYYVKYELSSSTIYAGRDIAWTLKNEDGEFLELKAKQGGRSEVIIGPVSEGFTAVMEGVAIGNTFGKLRLYGTIYTSQNNGPWVLKELDGSDETRDSITMIYTIPD